MTPEEAIAKFKEIAAANKSKEESDAAGQNKSIGLPVAGGNAPIKPFLSGLSIAKSNLDYDLNSSANRLEELRAGRNLTDIPLDDEYWKASRKHQFAFGSKK